MAQALNKTAWWLIAIFAILFIAFFFIIRGTFAEFTSEMKTLNGDLQNELMVLKKAVARKPSKGVVQVADLSDCPEVVDPLPKIEALRWEVALMAQSIEDIKLTLQKIPANVRAEGAEANLGDPNSEPSLPPLPPPPGSGTNPGGMAEWMQKASPEKREIVEQIFREQAELDRRKIEAESEDPTKPDLSVMARVMEESIKEIQEKLRQHLSEEDVEAMFPKIQLPTGRDPRAVQ